MNDGLLLALNLALSAVTLLGLAGLGLVAYRLRQQGRKQLFETQGKIHRELIESQRELAKQVKPLTASITPPDTVINRLSFADSLVPDKFAEASRQSTLDQLGRQSAQHFGDGVTVTVNAIQFVRSGAEMTVTLSKNGQKLLEEGKAVIARHIGTNSKLPFIQDVKTGQSLEMMKAAKGANRLRRLTALTNAVVGAAHIISGADIAQKLNIIDRKINLLIAYRKVDQMAKLERIYSSARELGALPLNREVLWELWRLRGELRELRYSWRRELEHHLKLVEDPKSSSWLRQCFTRQKSIDRKVSTQINEAQLQLALIEYSMRLDQVLAVGSGTILCYEKSLASELCELRKVMGLLAEKANYIKGEHKEVDVAPVVDGLDRLVTAYSALLPGSEVDESGQTTGHEQYVAPAAVEATGSELMNRTANS